MKMRSSNQLCCCLNRHLQHSLGRSSVLTFLIQFQIFIILYFLSNFLFTETFAGQKFDSIFIPCHVTYGQHRNCGFLVLNKQKIYMSLGHGATNRACFELEVGVTVATLSYRRRLGPRRGSCSCSPPWPPESAPPSSP